LAVPAREAIVGLVCPSHVLPLTEPGAFKIAIKSMLTPNSPFRIKPRMDPALWSWLWNFSRRCNHGSMIQAAHAIQALLVSAMREYEQLVDNDKIECEWQHKGLLFTYQSEKELDGYERTNQLLSEHFGEPARRLSSAESIALEPALKPTVAGSWFYEHDAHLRPDLLVHSLRTRLEDRRRSVCRELRVPAVARERHDGHRCGNVPRDLHRRCVPGRERRLDSFASRTLAMQSSD
jgi:D-amino-acid dehydrogenase